MAGGRFRPGREPPVGDFIRLLEETRPTVDGEVPAARSSTGPTGPADPRVPARSSSRAAGTAGVDPARRGAVRDVAGGAAVQPVVQHVWVAGPVEDPGPWAGVLVAWERRRDGWWGRVVYVLPGDAITDASVIDTWVPAVVLRPVLSTS